MAVAMETGHKMAGIVMMSELDFQYIIRKGNWKDIIYFLQECWFAVMQMENYIFMILSEQKKKRAHRLDCSESASRSQNPFHASILK